MRGHRNAVAYRAYIELCSRVRVVVVSVVLVQPARKIATSPRNVSAIRFFFIVQLKRIRSGQRMCPIPLKNRSAEVDHVLSFSMKTIYLWAVVALGCVALAGCATDTTATTQTQTDQTTTRVHTQEELRKTGETQTGPALEKADASVQTTGNR